MIFYSSLKEKYRGKKWSVGSSGVLTLDLTLNLPSCLIGGGSGTPLQRSCLENPMEGGAWWAAVRGGRYESNTTEWLGSGSSCLIPRLAEQLF